MQLAAWAGRRTRRADRGHSPDTTRPRDSDDRECRDHSRLLRSQSTLSPHRSCAQRGNYTELRPYRGIDPPQRQTRPPLVNLHMNTVVTTDYRVECRALRQRCCTETCWMISSWKATEKRSCTSLSIPSSSIIRAAAHTPPTPPPLLTWVEAGYRQGRTCQGCCGGSGSSSTKPHQLSIGRRSARRWR